MKEFLKPTRFKIVFSLIITIIFPFLNILLGLPYGTNNLLEGITSFFSFPALPLIFSDGVIFGLILFLCQFIVFYLFSCFLYKTSWKRIFFAVYLLFIIILQLRFYVFNSDMGEAVTLLSIFDMVITSISLLGLFLFVCNKELLSIFWKIWFPTFIVWDVVFNLLLNSIVSHTFNFVELFGFLLFLPLYFGLFLYAYKFKNDEKNSLSLDNSKIITLMKWILIVLGVAILIYIPIVIKQSNDAKERYDNFRNSQSGKQLPTIPTLN